MNLLHGKELIGVRPEKLRIGPAPESSCLQLNGILDMVEQTGDSQILYLKCSQDTVAIRVQEGEYTTGQELTCHARPQDLHTFPNNESADTH
jgi:ABC-type sugar transport system ATPase subunit